MNETIEKIIAEQYNNYKGNAYQTLKRCHSFLRAVLGKNKFLSFLEEQRIKNPRPVYQIPKEVQEAIKHSKNI